MTDAVSHLLYPELETRDTQSQAPRFSNQKHIRYLETLERLGGKRRSFEIAPLKLGFHSRNAFGVGIFQILSITA